MGKCLQQLLWECGKKLTKSPFDTDSDTNLFGCYLTFSSEAQNLGVENQNYDYDPSLGVDK